VLICLTSPGAAAAALSASRDPSPYRGLILSEFEGARHDVLNETVHREVAAAITEFVLSVAVPAETGQRALGA
jgi:hypothetical protein